MKITEIKPAARNKNKFNIYIDGNFEFSMFSDDINDLSLVEGMDIDKGYLNKIRKTIIYKNALNEALKLLARTDYPSKRILEKLTLKGYPEQIVSKVINYLNKNGYLNDYEYAKKYIENAMIIKKKGRAYIELELYKRGINREIISELLEKLYSSSEIIVVAEKKLNKILNGKENADYKDIRKLKEYLLRQGFSFDEINNAVDKLLKGTENI